MSNVTPQNASRFELIAFDADDTLWHNEKLFVRSQDRFKRLLSDYQDPDWIERKLYETEIRNLEYFGYGIKGFTLSMIETAIELTDGRIRGSEIQEVIELAKGMLKAPLQLLEHTEGTVARLAEEYKLALITKGDLFDQESKIAKSGLSDYFRVVEIVTEKTPETYQKILEKHSVPPHHFMMVGNSLKSDVLPVLEVGGHAVHIPYQMTWEHERVEEPPHFPGHYRKLEHIGQLPDLLKQQHSAAETV